TVGIMIGVASVTAVIAVIKGLEHKVLSEFEAFGTNKMFVFPSRGRDRSHFARYIFFRPHDFDGLLEHCPSVDKFSRIAFLNGPVSYCDRSETEVQVMGIEPQWHEIEHRTVEIGRPFSMIDNAQLRLVCMINEKGRDKLGLNR